MDFTFSSFAVFLSILWFLVYWILGGVFFSVIAILRLGRVRKVRFSCLFTIWALVVAIGVAFKGLEYSEKAILDCTQEATTKAETMTAVFGCGAMGIFGAFLLGSLALTLGGFLIFAVSRTKSKPWIVFDKEIEFEQTPSEEELKKLEQKSKFF